MKMQQIISEFFDSSIRVEKVLHLGTMCMDDAWPYIAREVFDEDAEQIWEAIGIESPECEGEEEWGEVLRVSRKLGFLIQVATPVPDGFCSDGSSFSFSWGYYTMHWIYDESFESACEKAMKWKEGYIESRRKAYLAEQKGMEA